MRRNSPFSGRPSIASAIFWDRSPLATAPMTRATSSVGWTRSPISELTEWTRSAQPPVALRQRQALIDLAFLPDREADPVELGGGLRELLRDVVEGFCDRPGHPDLVHGEPGREIAPPEGPHGAQHLLGIDFVVDRRLRVGGH